MSCFALYSIKYTCGPLNIVYETISLGRSTIKPAAGRTSYGFYVEDGNIFFWAGHPRLNNFQSSYFQKDLSVKLTNI